MAEEKSTIKNKNDVSPIDEYFEKALRLKSYAISQGYNIDDQTLETLNNLKSKVTLGPNLEQYDINKEITVEELNKLDQAISALTKVTHPVTIDTLSKEKESIEYKRFKNILLGAAPFTVVLAGISFYLSVEPLTGTNVLLGNNLLAIFLGLLGSVVYSLFNILRIIPPQAFNPTDLYSLYARLLLGPILGWLFYFSFAIDAFKNLATITDDTPDINTLLLMVPFLAGYSTKFVISLLEKMMQALELTIGVEEKRDISIKKSKEKA